VYQTDGKTLFQGKIYRSGDGALTYPNPFVVSPALVDIWFDDPTRVVLGVTNDTTTQVEFLSPVYDASLDADQAVFTTASLEVTGDMVANGLLRSSGTNTAVWFQPGLSPHDHHGIAPGTTRLNFPDGGTSRIASYVGTTAIGYSPESVYANPTYFYTFNQLTAQAANWAALTTGQWQTWSGTHILNTSDNLAYESMYGYGAYSTGSAAISIGFNAAASRGKSPTNVQGSTAIGSRSTSTSGSMVLGYRASTPLNAPVGFTGAQNMVVMGRNAGGYGQDAISLGAYSFGTAEGFSIGFNSGGVQNVNPGSISLGANSALPIGSGDSNKPILLLGMPDATEPVPMVAGALCYVPEGLTLRTPGKLNVTGSATLSKSDGKVGFFGVPPVTIPSVSEVEPGSGVEALDNLILALRAMGLLNTPNEAVLRYDAEGLSAAIANKAPVTSWSEAFSGRLLASQGTSPTLSKPSPTFNNRPAVVFSSAARLVENAPSGSVTHYVAVASHPTPKAIVNESLVTLNTPDVRNTVFAAATGVGNTDRWASTMGKYELDGLDQSGNNRIQTDGNAHVYRATLNGGWPGAETVLGHRLGSALPGWTGSLAEVVGLDETWNEAEVSSLTRGLMFKYHVNQIDSQLLNPAEALVSQDPTGINVSLDRVTAKPGVINGSVVIPNPSAIGFLPTVAPHRECQDHDFRGPLSGIWYELSQLLHLIEVYILPTLTTTPSAQYLLGRFEIDAANIWTTGKIQADKGYKFCRPVRRDTHAPIDCVGNKLTAQLNAQVALYTEVGGVKTLETIVPLRPDFTFFGNITHTGTVIAELRKISDTTVLGTSRRNLPQTTVGQTQASLQDFALLVMALVALPPRFHFRAQQILLKILSIQGSDGSVPTVINVASPTNGDGAFASGPMALIAVAALKYQQVTGDTQFATFAQKIANLLLSRNNGFGTPVSLPGSTVALAIDAVQAYWLWEIIGMVPAATSAAECLLGTFWQQDLSRCAKSISIFVADPGAVNSSADTTHDLWTDVWTGMFFHAIKDQAKARSIRNAMGAFRRRSIPLLLP
jgi:hypothetical protein